MSTHSSTGKFFDRTILLSVLVLLFVSACGGSDNAAPAAAPPPPPSGIGAAGGTVTGPNGSSLVVPANALLQNTALAIAIGSQGAPASPANAEPAGEIYAFTPHGTAFALPATVTVPFDSSRVPVGRSTGLIKTNAAQNAWESVPGATVSGNTMTAQTSSLSWWLVVLAAAAPTIATEPVDVTANVGQPATFNVVANPNGAPITSYQWRRNGNPISGATSASYSIASTNAGDDNATFDVVVTNSAGSITSRAATLTVITPTAWQTLGGQINVVTSTARSVRQPSVTVAPNGTIYVAYIESSSDPGGTSSSLDGSLRVRRLLPGASTWADVGGVLNSSTETQPEWPNIRARSDSLPVVAWASRAIAGSGTFNQIIVQQFDGSAWQRLGTEAGGINIGALGATLPLLVLGSGTDVPHVAFIEGNCNLYRTWNGSTWEPGMPRACAASSQSSIALGVSSGGTVFVAGSPVPPPPSGNLVNWISVRYRGPSDGGLFNSQLSGNPVNSTPVTEVLDADLALSMADRPFIAYAFRAPANALVVREWSGVLWSALGGDLLTSDPMLTDPLVRTSRVRIESVLGVVGVAWSTGTQQSTRITGRVWNGSLWERVPAPHAVGANIGHFGVAVAPGGEPHVALTERLDTQANPALGTSLYVRTCADWCL